MLMQAMDSNNPKAGKRDRKLLGYAIFLAFIGVLVFFSIRIKPLDSRMQQETTFDIAAYVDDFFRDSLPGRIDQALEVCVLFSHLSVGNDADWEQHGHRPTIGSRYYFLTVGTGIVEQVEESFVVLNMIGADMPCTVRIATEYIFGNAVRDASGVIQLEDLDDLTTFNRISEIINERIRTQVLPPFVNAVQLNDTVFVAGACSINKRLMDTTAVELVPIDLKINR